MGLMNCLKQKICREDWRDARDENQKKYREKFEIIDKFLLNYEDNRFIVYVDGENDIDWVEISDFKDYTDEERKQFYEAVAKLDRAQTYPCMLLKEEYALSFKRILGAGYVAAFHKSFSTIDETIEEAKNYVRHRNLEKARQIFLSWAGVITFFAILFLVWLHIKPTLWPLSKEVTTGIVFGVAGAYLSIWLRYDDLLMKGFSTRTLLALEAISRLFVGAISAYVVYLAYQCQIVFNLLSSIDNIYVCSFLGFLGGLCERFVPSLVESFANKSLKENKEKE